MAPVKAAPGPTARVSLRSTRSRPWPRLRALARFSPSFSTQSWKPLRHEPACSASDTPFPAPSGRSLNADDGSSVRSGRKRLMLRPESRAGRFLVQVQSGRAPAIGSAHLGNATSRMPGVGRPKSEGGSNPLRLHWYLFVPSHACHLSPRHCLRPVPCSKERACQAAFCLKQVFGEVLAPDASGRYCMLVWRCARRS